MSDYSGAVNGGGDIKDKLNHDHITRNRGSSRSLMVEDEDALLNYGSIITSTMATINTSPPSSTPTVASLSPLPSSSSPTPLSSSSLSPLPCPPFPSAEDYDAYLHSISPPRELVCPITQDLLRDPVVAEDGYTYERKSLLRWFNGVGRTRSPVTNSIMTGRNVFSNVAVQGMAQAHRERLGRELLRRCRYVCYGSSGDVEHSQGRRIGGGCGDGGSRIAALLDSGADVTMKDSSGGGDTALAMLIRARELHLCRMVLQHEMQHHSGSGGEESVMVMLRNNEGGNCVDLAEKVTEGERGESKALWAELVNSLKRKLEMEEKILKEREGVRRRNNEEHRERQRTLAESERAAAAAANRGHHFGPNHRGGLGQMQDYGWGYFPSLSALQFQGAIPPPSASIAEFEDKAKRQLNRILCGVGFIAALVFFFT